MNPCQEDLKMESEKLLFCGDWNPQNPVHLSMPGVAIGNLECAIGTEVYEVGYNWPVLEQRLKKILACFPV